MTRLPVSLSLILTGILALSASAQPGRETGRQPFRIPEAGETLPDVNAFDDEGRSFSTSSLRGRYSVLVFGCLT